MPNLLKSLSLIVLKTNQLEALKDFYSKLGFEFEEHQHVKGPKHFASTIGNTVFEIYPLPKSMTIPDKSLRLGFYVENLTATLAFLEKENIKIVVSPKEYDWGWTAVIKDLDGRKIELTQALNQ